ncbi:SprT-like domain-containing protein [Spiroplasma endosymbiont of Othius punctulatus]|uniref:SprT-like domain-containing protein n=1 Tax=Spiroplasma endosymbiont of Othius punctulatus TaxID=3066289 RepID=UPI0030D59EF3
MNINIDEIITELNSLHNQLNKLLFDSKLKPVKIGIETSKFRRVQAWAYFDSNSGWQDGLSQITFLTSRWNGDYIKIISTLVHEMSHQYNFENNIKDTEPSNGRHNKNFKSTASTFGLLNVESSNGVQGLNITNASDELIVIIENKLDFNKEALKVVHVDSVSIQKNKQKNYKYQCNCVNTIYLRKKVNISCNDCNTPFVLKSV